MEGDPPTLRPLTPKRQKILEKAFAQLRKSRASMDPKLISKIRRMVASSPDIMKKLGVAETLKPSEDMPLSTQGKSESDAKPKATPKQSPQSAQKKENIKGNYESVDQAKNMEVMAKLMALNPKGRDQIKSAIKKAID